MNSGGSDEEVDLWAEGMRKFRPGATWWWSSNILADDWRDVAKALECRADFRRMSAYARGAEALQAISQAS